MKNLLIAAIVMGVPAAGWASGADANASDETGASETGSSETKASETAPSDEAGASETASPEPETTASGADASDEAGANEADSPDGASSDSGASVSNASAEEADAAAAEAAALEAAALEASRAGEMPGNQRITWERRRQVPFFRDGGVLNRKETAVGLYVDGDLFPPAIMASIQRGIFYWLTVGLDVGGDAGVFQALLRIKQEMARTRGTNAFLWGWHIRTGYKYAKVDLRDSLGPDSAMRFDDNSWVLGFQNTFSFRFGSHRRRSVYLTTELYWDFDLRGEGLQTDFYFFPAKIGFETVLGTQWNFFFEGGVIWSVNGWQLLDAQKTVMSPDGDVFPTASMGFAYRFGGVRTALPANWRDPVSLPMR